LIFNQPVRDIRKITDDVTSGVIP